MFSLISPRSNKKKNTKSLDDWKVILCITNAHLSFERATDVNPAFSSSPSAPKGRTKFIRKKMKHFEKAYQLRRLNSQK